MGSSPQQLNAYLSPSFRKRMARSIRYEFVDDYSQSPTTVRPQQEGTGGKHQVYLQPIEPGTADREAELAKVGRRVTLA
jgi:hypothetical protein